MFALYGFLCGIWGLRIAEPHGAPRSLPPICGPSVLGPSSSAVESSSSVEALSHGIISGENENRHTPPQMRRDLECIKVIVLSPGCSEWFPLWHGWADHHCHLGCSWKVPITDSYSEWDTMTSEKIICHWWSLTRIVIWAIIFENCLGWVSIIAAFGKNINFPHPGLYFALQNPGRNQLVSFIKNSPFICKLMRNA